MVEHSTHLAKVKGLSSAQLLLPMAQGEKITIKRFCIIGPVANVVKTCFVRNLRIFVIS